MRPATVVIGTIGRPHGTGGAVHARASGPTLASLAPGDTVEVRPREGEPRTLLVRGRSGMDRSPILAFAGVADRPGAAELTGAVIAVEASRIRELDDPDTFFVRDLIGCQVLIGDRPLGPVTEVFPGPANDALQVTGPDGPVLLPFTADAVRDLDVAGRRIVMRPDLLGDPAP